MGSSKDADMSPFEAGRRLLSSETSRMSLMDRTELVFQDMDLVPLLVQVRTTAIEQAHFFLFSSVCLKQLHYNVHAGHKCVDLQDS